MHATVNNFVFSKFLFRSQKLFDEKKKSSEHFERSFWNDGKGTYTYTPSVFRLLSTLWSTISPSTHFCFSLQFASYFKGCFSFEILKAEMVIVSCHFFLFLSKKTKRFRTLDDFVLPFPFRTNLCDLKKPKQNEWINIYKNDDNTTIWMNVWMNARKEEDEEKERKKLNVLSSYILCFCLFIYLLFFFLPGNPVKVISRALVAYDLFFHCNPNSMYVRYRPALQRIRFFLSSCSFPLNVFVLNGLAIIWKAKSKCCPYLVWKMKNSHTNFILLK